MADLPDTDVRMKDTDARMKDTDVRMKDADARKGPVASLSYDKLSYDKLSALEPRGGVTLELSDGTRCLFYHCLSYCCFTALLLYCFTVLQVLFDAVLHVPWRPGGLPCRCLAH